MHRRLAATVLFLYFTPTLIFADKPAPQREYSVLSPNGAYQFTMYPASNAGDSDVEPRGEAREVRGDSSQSSSETGKVLWDVQGWYSFETFIADDGRGLVRIGPWASLPMEEELAVAFYRDGQEIRRYVVGDLVENEQALQRTVSHYTWQIREVGLPKLIRGNQFQLRTIENRVVTFDVRSGDMINPAVGRPASTPMPLAAVTREDADDQFLAMNLFSENGIEITASRIVRVTRGEQGTRVSVTLEYAGLPVFLSTAEYSFGKNRMVDKDPATGKPLVRGDRLLPTTTFPIDHRADVDSKDAIATWLAEANTNSQTGPGYGPKNDPVATLGFFDLNVRRTRHPVYRLAWKVAPGATGYPLAYVDAKKGDLLHFESGATAAAASAPGNNADSELGDLSGSWIGKPCGGRPFSRKLVLYPNGDFIVIDRAEETYRGTWHVDRNLGIELEPDSDNRRSAEPLPLAMGFDRLSKMLHEATPGAPELCHYSRMEETSP